MVSFWCLYCKLSTYFTPLHRISVVDFEQVNVCWVITKKSAPTYMRDRSHEKESISIRKLYFVIRMKFNKYDLIHSMKGLNHPYIVNFLYDMTIDHLYIFPCPPPFDNIVPVTYGVNTKIKVIL